MALTVQRWVVVAALGCLALAAAYLPPEPDRVRTPEVEGAEPVTAERARLNRLSRAYTLTRDALSNEQFRDSLRRALARPPASDGQLQVVVHGPLPTSSQREFRLAVDRIWQSLDRVPGAGLVVILRANEYWVSEVYVLPSALDSNTCVAAISVDWSVRWLKTPTQDGQQSNLDPWIRDAVAPCLYFAAFGQPGAAIERWLTDRSFKPANSADWETPLPTLRFADEPNAYDIFRSDVSFNALACTAYDVRRCRAALLAPLGNDMSGRRKVAGVVRRSYWPVAFLAEQHYLASLVREMGSDRFGRFWRSTAPVDSAFYAAFGQPIDVWTAGWAHHVTPDMHGFGPRPRPRAVFFALALAAMAVAAAAAGVMRRQVG